MSFPIIYPHRTGLIPEFEHRSNLIYLSSPAESRVYTKVDQETTVYGHTWYI